MQLQDRIRLAFLIVPALMALQYWGLAKSGSEPYPVLTMPSGSGVERQGKRLSTERFDVYAVDASGKERELDVPLLLQGLPSQYRNRVLSRHLGLSRKLPAREQQRLRAFLSDRAERQVGSRPQAIVFKRVRVTVERGSIWSSEPKLAKRTLSVKRFALENAT